jgi:UDP-GlcNAc:undecaprenyl-phosphate GlcNAc-1-phosphate transferase
LASGYFEEAEESWAINKEMNDVVLAFLFSGFISALIIPGIIRFSLKLKLFDTHDLHRKKHAELVSRMGGIGIFLGYFIAVHLFADFNSLIIHALTSSTLIIFCLGLKDDLLGGATPREKFIVQSLAAITLTVFGGSKSGLLFVECFPEWGFGVIFLEICAILLIVNAFNFIDGINGLAGVLGVLINVFLGSCLIICDDGNFAIVTFALAGATSAFLIYNFIPNKVFMGDSGAMIIGLTTAATCLRFVGSCGSHQPNGFSLPLLVILSLLIVPVFDVFRIFVIRGLQGKAFLVGDRNHIHHRLQDLGVSDFQAVLILMAFTSIAVIIALIGQNSDGTNVSLFLSSLCLVSNTALSYFRGRRLFPNYKLSDVIVIDTLNKG